ncbi:MAG: long-chain fatty acid--CoA ligase [Actinobacteria bacterium]|nr:long-chain fatty acid--CoA ligase [Actinomycetota bacterium]
MTEPGETNLVAVALPPAEAVGALWRSWDAGEAVMPLDPRAPGPEVERVVAALRPTHVLDRDGRSPVRGGVPAPDGTAAVVATSGTTGRPKGVVLSASGLQASAAGVSEALGSPPGHRWLCCLPLHHVAGLAVVGRSWVAGVTPAVHPRFDPDAVGAAARDEPVPLVSIVPIMLRRLLDAGVALHRFHRILVGGAALPPELAERAAAAQAPVVTTYGLTETWGGIVHDGHPLRGVEVRLGTSDEILVRAPMTMTGYRDASGGTPDAFTADGWLATGDVGRCGSDGRLHVVDRLRDLVITGGVSVAPSEVEAVLAAHPGVADVCVAGAPDPEWGERVVAYVVPCDPGVPPTLEDLQAFARSRLSGPKLPREVALLETVPRTPGGKPLRRMLGTATAPLSDPGVGGET